MELKKEVNMEEKKGSLILENRNKLQLTGIVEVISFNEEEILLSTKIGGLNIQGQNLKMNKLDVNNGDLNITGKVNSCVYTDKEKNNKKDSIFSRLFK